MKTKTLRELGLMHFEVVRQYQDSREVCDKNWTSNDSLITRLQEALSKTADSSKIVAVKRILKELEDTTSCIGKE